MKHLSAKTLLLSAIIFASSFGMMSDANPNSTIKSFANLEFLQAGDAFNEKVRDISEIEPSEPEKANRLRKIVALIVTKEAFEETSRRGAYR